MRKLAREAVIFMLLGPVLLGFGSLIYLNLRSVGQIKSSAESAVHAWGIRPGFIPPHGVVVPLSSGERLQVMDCDWLHHEDEDVPVKPILPSPTIGSDCVNFAKDASQKLNAELMAVPLGNADQIEIEKKYWAAYANAKHEYHVRNAMTAALIGLYGFPAGIIVWALYRLVLFAVKG